MSKLYVLFVAINEYHPDSEVSNLEGCENDVKAMKSFLKKYYGILNPSIKSLINENATREKILQTFDSHLIKNAKPGDTVLFYYSGHGSTSETASAFKKFDPKAQDETLVCYDSRLAGQHDLTDKEIAVLLSRIAENVHTVVIADSCHSGSLTRSIKDNSNFGKKRFIAPRKSKKARSLKSYMLAGDDYYTNAKKKTKELVIPRSQHILLSACDRDEEALETFDDSGLFSSTLLSVLENNRTITYADLFVKVRRMIKSDTDNQTPTIAPNEGFNPNTIFLRSELKNNHSRYQVTFQDGHWRLDYGGIHGLPTDAASVKKLTVGIYEDINSTIQIKAIKVERVLLKESVLEFDEVNTNKTFVGELQTVATPMLVYIKGTVKAVKAFKEIYNKKPSPFLLLDPKTKDATYQLDIGKTDISIKTKKGELIHGVNGIKTASINYISDILERIEEWERLANLENKSSKIEKAISMRYMDTPDNNDAVELIGESITLEYPDNGKDVDENGVPTTNWFAIKAKNTSRKKLYIALFHLSADYQVNVLFPCSELKPGSKWITLDDQHGLYIKKPEWNEVTDVFKLIVSTAPFDDYKFQQDGFDRGQMRKSTTGVKMRSIRKRRKPETDWCVNTITVHTIRTKSKINEAGVNFKKEKIRIKGHPKFKADVAFAPLKSGSRSVHPQAVLADIFKDENLSILNLSSSRTRNVQDKSIIRLSGIDAAQEKSLSKQPLEIIVNQKIGEDEQIIPITYDGEFVIPFGKATRESNGDTKISIDALPKVKDVHKKRSVKKALWFVLLKVTGFRNKAFRLRVAQINNKGKLIRTTRAIQSKVDRAQKILVVVHGIIGDTKSMAKNLMFLVNQGHYDLMLSFDYENLNEPIEDIAKEFNSRLKDLGLNAKDGKQLDIIAHSMGGLVSRFMIENIRKGDKLVDRLIMFGTPNGGSVFGSIPEYIDMFTTLAAVAINFAKPFLGPMVAYLNGLEQVNKVIGISKHVTVTLDQMNQNSTFIKNLYKNKKTAARYYIIAGDITNYDTSVKSGFGRFMEKVLLKIGDKMNRSTPNDVAVGCDQIKAVPKALVTDATVVVCHHLNYFENQNSMDELWKLYS